MEKIGYAFIEADRSVYPADSYLQEFLEDEENLLVIYPIDEIDGEEADEGEFCNRYGDFLDGPVEALCEWVYTFEDREEAQNYLNNLGFIESKLLIDRFEDLPL